MSKNTPIAFFAALNAKRVTLIERIARYTEYVAHDKATMAASRYPKKYASRLRNHEAKLERYKQALSDIEATLSK